MTQKRLEGESAKLVNNQQGTKKTSSSVDAAKKTFEEAKKKESK